MRAVFTQTILKALPGALWGANGRHSEWCGRPSYPHAGPVSHFATAWCVPARGRTDDEPERGWSIAATRATSSGQPASASLARGDARVPGSTAPGVGRDPAVEAEQQSPWKGASNWPVCSGSETRASVVTQTRREADQERAEPLRLRRRPRKAPRILERVPKNSPA